MAIAGLPSGSYDPWLFARALPRGVGNSLVPTGIEVLGHTPMSRGEQIAQAIDAESRPFTSRSGGNAAISANSAASRAAAQAAGGPGGAARSSMPALGRAGSTGGPGFTSGSFTAGRGFTPPVNAAGAAQSAAGGRFAQFLGGRAGSAPTWLTQRLGGQATAGLGLRSMAKGSLGRAGLYGLGGQLAGMGVESALGAREGSWDDAARNAAVGAGYGAALGSVVPVIGTGAGALIGGIGGGIHGLVTGRDSKATEAARAIQGESEAFNEAFSEYGVSPQTREQFLMQFALSTDGLGRKEVSETAQQMRSMLPQIIMEDQAARQQDRSRMAMFAAAQGWMAPMMQQVQGRATSSADQLMQASLNAAQGIGDPAARAFAIEDARRIPLDTASNQAYAMQQLMSLPGLYGYQTQGGGVPGSLNAIMGATPMSGVPQGMAYGGSMFGAQQPQVQMNNGVPYSASGQLLPASAELALAGR